LIATVSHQSHRAFNYIAAHRDKHKLSKYEAMGTKYGWQNAPLLFTSYGHPTASTVEWFKTMSKNAVVYDTSYRLQAVTTIACTRGNTDLSIMLNRDLPALSNCVVSLATTSGAASSSNT
jgi:hypothetical protein